LVTVKKSERQRNNKTPQIAGKRRQSRSQKSYPHFLHGQLLSTHSRQNGPMKNRSKGNDGQLEKQFEGLTRNQKRLLASIYAALAQRLREKAVADSLKNWKSREDWSRN
jgi:hypothetical protein